MKNNQNSSITNDNNQDPFVTQTAHSSLEDSLKQEIRSLKKEVKSLKAQSRWNSGIIGLGVIGLIGYAIATNWSAVAAAGTATAAVLPVIGIAVATIVAATVLVGASYLAWRHRAEIKAGFKYAAEKTVEGARYTAGKIKAGTMRAGNAVKKGYKHSVDSLERGAKNAANRLGSSLKEFAHSGEHPMESQLVQKLLRQNGIKKVVNDTITIVKEGNSSVLTAIQSKLVAKSLKNILVFDSAGKDHTPEIKDHTLGLKNNLEKRNKKVVDRLKEILAKSTLDAKELKFVVDTFSAHKDEIQGVLDDYKQHPEKYPKPLTFSQRMSSSLSSSFSSLGGKDSTQSERSEAKVPLQEPFSSDLGMPDNIATVDPTRLRRKSSLTSLGDSPVPTPVAPPKAPGGQDTSLENEWSNFVERLMEQHKLSASRSGSPDSGKGPSGSSTPTKEQSPEKPTTYKSEIHIDLQQPAPTQGATAGNNGRR